ncbi:MAG: cysteine synthase A [Candidatus Symbiobacter sp.]|nr:cysteine synthase A [Candidatus Symbiobacter sp.]
MTKDTQNFRGKIYDSILDTIGHTPIVRLSRFAKQAGVEAEILGKLEFFNPLSSVKDRIGLAMIAAAEKEKPFTKDTVLVEPTSGNTGIALAFVCAAKGIKLILTMPESMSLERRKILRLLGADLRLTPAAQGMRGAIAAAEQLVNDTPGAIMLQQFNNPANPAIHRVTTAPEILADTGGKLDVFVSGVGTGGTLTGAGGELKKALPKLHIAAVEPEDSPVLSGGSPGPHKIQGIGAGFVPSILDRSLINEVIGIANDTAFRQARALAAQEGIPVGISSGAALAAALEIARRPAMKSARILVILPSSAERYLSTALFEGLE